MLHALSRETTTTTLGERLRGGEEEEERSADYRGGGIAFVFGETRTDMQEKAKARLRELVPAARGS